MRNFEEGLGRENGQGRGLETKPSKLETGKSKLMQGGKRVGGYYSSGEGRASINLHILDNGGRVSLVLNGGITD